jgi:hypothetical protein
MLRSGMGKVMWVGRTKALVFGLVVAGALFLVLLSGVTLATTFPIERSFQCTDVPCYGTNKNEVIGERQGNGKQDDIHARGGHDELRAGRWGNDTDVLRGQKGNFDFLNSKDGDRKDVLICGSGNQDAVKADLGDTVADGCDIFVGATASQVNVVSEAKAEQIAANRLQ